MCDASCRKSPDRAVERGRGRPGWWIAGYSSVKEGGIKSSPSYMVSRGHILTEDTEEIRKHDLRLSNSRDLS